MKKHFLNIGLLFAIALATVAFVSCKTDKADESFVIKAENVINSSAEIATVKIKLYNEKRRGEIMPSIPFLQTSFQNNGFEIMLPSSISNEYLTLIAEQNEYMRWLAIELTYVDFDFEEYCISDENAKWFQLTGANTVQIFDKNDNQLGTLNLTYTSENENEWREWRVGWIFVDRDVVVKKEEISGYWETHIEIVDLNLRKGWNIVYTMSEVISNQRKITSVLTTTKPANIAFSWVAKISDDEMYFMSEMWMRVWEMMQDYE